MARGFERPFTLELDSVTDIDEVLTIARPVLDKVTSIYVKNSLSLNCLKETIVLTYMSDLTEMIGNILKHVRYLPSSRYITLRVPFSPEKGYELFDLLHENVHELHIGQFEASSVTLRQCYSWPNLVQLSITNQTIPLKVIETLSGGMKDGCFPSLTHLNMIHCQGENTSTEDIRPSPVSLSKLFDTPCPQLRHLNLYGTFLGKDDVKALSAGSRKENPRLPNLEALVLSIVYVFNAETSMNSLWKRPLKNVTNFILDDPDKAIYEQFSNALRESRLPKLTDLTILLRNTNESIKLKRLQGKRFKLVRYLTLHRWTLDMEELGLKVKPKTLLKLDISYSSGVRGSLSLLLRNNFKVLKSLILSNCGLNSADFQSLAEAYVNGRYPELKHLDVSHNSAELMELFSADCTWNQLLSLNVVNVHYNKTNNSNEVKRNLKQGAFSDIAPSQCLESVRELSFSNEMFVRLGIKLQHLETMHLATHNAEKNFSPCQRC